MKKIYLLCTDNSCRSQIAEGYARKYLSPPMFEIRSAGIEAYGLSPGVIKIMVEDGTDTFKQIFDLIDRDYFTQVDLVITLRGDAKDKCPAVPNNRRHPHWDLKGPVQAVRNEEEILTEFRKVREGIKKKVLDSNQRISTV